MKETTLPINEIAYKVGFNNISHFNRAFRQYGNSSPQEYRSQPYLHICIRQVLQILSLSFNYSGGTITINVSSLKYYNVLVLDYVAAITGVTNLQSTGSVTAYPNPASDVINFSNLPANAASIQITDVTGRAVMQRALPAAINVSALKQGVYIYSITDNTGATLITSRFVK